MYKYLLFDADNTLFDFNKAEAWALEHSLKLEGIVFKEDYLSLYDGINKAFWRAFEEKKISSEALKYERFEVFFEKAGIEGLDPRSFSGLYLDSLAQGSQLMEGAQELVEALAQRAKLFIITNGLTKVQRPRFEGSSLRPHIQDIIISEEVGYAKPDAKIFDIAFELMGNPQKQEVLMIGDNPIADIEGALNYGLHACWFKAKAHGPHQPKATFIIDQLHELYNHL
ncbi:MAG: YjjG family noncanonical pyrimidine nucleotidase [Deinococcales bacterium]